MPRPALRLVALAAPAAVAALALAACSGSSGCGSGSPAAGAITVNATNTAGELRATTAKAGTVTFEITDAGSKVNEFYVYGAGDRIVAEVENIAPGRSRQLKVEIT